MSRYANRPQQHYNRPSEYYQNDLGSRSNGPVGYDDDDEDTMVATDISAMPRAHHGARTTWGQKDTRYFDKSAPPQSVERPRHSGASLAVPSHGRPRAHSFDGGRRTAYREPEPEYDDDEPEYSPPPRQAYRAPAPSRAPPAPHGYSSYLGHDEDLGNSSNEDKFTAVGTGVATDLDMDEEEAGMVAGGMAMYGRDPRDGHMHQRSASALAGYDTRLGVHAHQQNNSQGGYHTTMQATQRTRKGDMMSYQDHDLGPAPGLAPPRSIQRPSLADGRRSVHPARYDSPPARYEAPPVSRPPPPEDSPEERQLIRLLKDMNFSVALKDFHDTFGSGVQKTIVASDGMGHAYCKIHCKKLPRASEVEKEPHLKRHWIQMAGNRWLFRTESHKVEGSDLF